MSLTVTGTIGIDTVFTPDGQHRENVLGGSCTYFAAAASFYTPVRMVAVVGDDFPADFRRTIARFANVDTAGLETRSGSKTFRWGGRYQPDMDHRDTLYTELNVLTEAPPPVPAAYRDSRFVFLANTHPAVQIGLLDQFPGRGLAVADTMDLWISTARAELELLLTRVDGLVLNFDEAEQFTGLRNTVAAGRRLLDFGPRFVVVKKGEHGAILVHRDGIAALPAYPAERVVDPTGAGDSFAGGLMGFLASSRDAAEPGAFDAIRRAMAHGTVIASFTIEAFSLERLASLTRAEIDARFAEYQQMLRLH
ncbi:MAG: sugar kinase [Leptolyngbya sp. PLA2]|nr:sugar kinase [Leptolyngbya sp.]MCE7970850.1 sugar kinase [Leptolyngbya sp. PL-A2]MCQ3940335.1 sugar kinase [cyanobacterium CYA1]MCZ7633689.1 PfkB family carbohydrate kinase [Phycisphaerales bacterium]MDL1904595.1 sugar kinase [Synechococcales cyanobacterium CNB]